MLFYLALAACAKIGIVVNPGELYGDPQRVTGNEVRSLPHSPPSLESSLSIFCCDTAVIIAACRVRQWFERNFWAHIRTQHPSA